MKQPTPTSRDAFCCLAEGGLFAGLAPEHRRLLESTRAVRCYGRGDYICHEGDPADVIYCLHDGFVKLYKSTDGGDEVAIRLLRPGDLLGYRPLFAGEPLAASARALNDVTLCTIAAEAIYEAVQCAPMLALRLLRKLAGELRVSEEEMVARVSLQASPRVARFLLSAAAEHAGGEAATIAWPLRREDMAAIIGIAPETLSRVLRYFETDEIVRLDRHHLRLLDPQRLASIAAAAPWCDEAG